MRKKLINDPPRRGDHEEILKRFDEVTVSLMDLARGTPYAEKWLHWCNYRRRIVGLKDLQRSGRQRPRRAS